MNYQFVLISTCNMSWSWCWRCGETTMGIRTNQSVALQPSRKRIHSKTLWSIRKTTATALMSFHSALTCSKEFNRLNRFGNNAFIVSLRLVVDGLLWRIMNATTLVRMTLSVDQLWWPTSLWSFQTNTHRPARVRQDWVKPLQIAGQNFGKWHR